MTSATIFPDTTILIQYRSLDSIEWEELFGVNSVKLMMAPSVIQEIEEIENQDISKTLSRRASQALDWFRRMLNRSSKKKESVSVYLLEEPDIDFDAEGLDHTSVTDLLIANIIAYQKSFSLEYTLLLTDDREAQNKAIYAGIEVSNLPKRYLLNAKNEKKPAEPPSISTMTRKHDPTILLTDLLAKPTTLFPHSQSEGNDEEAEAHDPAVNHHEEKQHISVENEASSSPFVDIIQEPAKPNVDHLKLISKNRESAPAFSGNKSADSVTKEETTDSQPASVLTPTSFSFVSQTSKSPSVPPTSETLISEDMLSEKPDIRLSIGGDEIRTTVTIHHPIYPSLDDINNHLSNIRKTHPKLKLPYEASGDGLGNGINDTSNSFASDSILQRKAQRIKKYNASLDAYYAGIEKYLSDVAEFKNLRRRSAQLDLILHNDLPDSLKSLYISIHFPGNVRVYYEDSLPERPVNPKPPEEPDLDMLFDPIRLPSVPVPNELSTVPDLKMRGRNPAPMEIRWNKGWDVIYSIKEIDENAIIPFNPLYIVFNSFDHATSFRVNYRITVASASYEQLGDLEVVVRKEL